MPSTSLKNAICALMSAVETARWWTPLQRIIAGPPSPRSLVVRRNQVLRLRGQAEELAAVAERIRAAAAVRDRHDRREARRARILRAAEHHAELRDGGGELEVRRGRLEGGAPVDDREVELHALASLRLLVAELHRAQLLRRVDGVLHASRLVLEPI